MKFKIKKLLIILISVLVIISIIFISGIYYLVKSESKATNYLVKVIASTKFSEITKNMDVKDFNNFKIYSENKIENSYYKLIQDSLQKGNNDVKKIYGQTGTSPLRIVVFSTAKEYNKAFNSSAKYDAARYDKYALYLSLDTLTLHNFIHEYVHFKTESFCNDKKINPLTIPSWFGEGISEYISFQYYINKQNEPSLKQIKPFIQLKYGSDFYKAQQEGYDVYSQSYLAVKKIIALKGEKSIQNILIDSKDMDFYSAFEKNMGLSIEEFQGRFLSVIRFKNKRHT